MTQQEIQERNKQIALMLGFKYKNQAKYWGKYPLDDNSFLSKLGYVMMCNLKFHSDWNWLMEAVEFIEKLKFNTKACIHCNNDSVYLKTYPFQTEDLHSARFISATSDEIDFCYALEPTKKQAVFIAVSDFAKLYNEKKL